MIDLTRPNLGLIVLIDVLAFAFGRIRRVHVTRGVKVDNTTSRRQLFLLVFAVTRTLRVFYLQMLDLLYSLSSQLGVIDVCRFFVLEIDSVRQKGLPIDLLVTFDILAGFNGTFCVLARTCVAFEVVPGLFARGKLAALVLI